MPDSQVMAQAERWWARMDRGDCSAAEMAAFERWRALPAHAAAYERVADLWSQLASVAGHGNVDRLSADALRVTESAGRRTAIRRASALAASVCAGVLTASAFYWGWQHLGVQTYATDIGQRSTIRLQDGSQVVMNVGTRIAVKFESDRRHIVLKSGEADFSVTRDASRPFTVSAGESKVTALGTRFQVRNESNRVTVTLLEGRVAVDDASTDKHVQLVPGEQVELATGATRLKPQAVDVAVVSSWTSGRLKFSATPLGQALDEVNRYSKTKVRLRDAALENTPVTGAFDVGDVESVVAAVEAMLPVKSVRTESDTIVLMRK